MLFYSRLFYAILISVAQVFDLAQINQNWFDFMYLFTPLKRLMSFWSLFLMIIWLWLQGNTFGDLRWFQHIQQFLGLTIFKKIQLIILCD